MNCSELTAEVAARLVRRSSFRVPLNLRTRRGASARGARAWWITFACFLSENITPLVLKKTFEIIRPALNQSRVL